MFVVLDTDFYQSTYQLVPNSADNTVKFDCDLYSCDIASPYTNIPNALGIEFISYYIDLRRLTKEIITESVIYVLNNNNTKFAPSYACLTIGYLGATKLYIQLPHHLIVRSYNQMVSTMMVLSCGQKSYTLTYITI